MKADYNPSWLSEGSWLWRWGLDVLGGILLGLTLGLAVMLARVPGGQ